jgi:hypothetical protein
MTDYDVIRSGRSLHQTYKIGAHTIERSAYMLPQWEPEKSAAISLLAWIERNAGRLYNLDVVIDGWEKFTFDEVTLMEMARITDDLRRYLEAVEASKS